MGGFIPAKAWFYSPRGGGCIISLGHLGGSITGYHTFRVVLPPSFQWVYLSYWAGAGGVTLLGVERYGASLCSPRTLVLKNKLP